MEAELLQAIQTDLSILKVMMAICHGALFTIWLALVCKEN